MDSNWLKLGLAAFFSAAVFVAPGCGGGDDNDDDDDASDTGGDDVNGILAPAQDPVGDNVDALEACSGLDLSEGEALLGSEQDLAESLLNNLLGFATSETGAGDLTDLGDVLGDSNEPLSDALDGIEPLLDQLVEAGLVDGALAGSSVAGDASGDAGGAVSITQTPEIDEITDLVGNIQGDIDAGLPGGVDELVTELNLLGTLLEDLPLTGGDANENFAANTLLDAIGGVLGQDADLIGSIGNLDSDGAGLAFDGLLDELAPLATDCAGTANNSLDAPLALIGQTFDDSNLPILSVLFDAIGTDIGEMDFEQILATLIDGDLTSLGGVSGLEGLVAGTQVDELRGNLALLGDLLGPLAGLTGEDGGGLPALQQLLSGGTDLEGFTSLFGGIPGLDGLTPGQTSNLVGLLLTPVGGVAPIESLGLGGGVVPDLDLIGGLLGGLLGGLGG